MFFGKKYLAGKSQKPTKTPTAAPIPVWDAIGSNIPYSLSLGFNSDTTDDTMLWQLMLPQPFRPGITNKVIIRKGKISVGGIGEGFPGNIYIAADDVNGYLNGNGSVTGNMAAFGLASVSSLSTNPPTYDCIYEKY